MKIFSIEAGPVQTMAYIVYDELSADAIIIDVPLESATTISSKIKELKLNAKAIILTHSHWDHSAEAPSLAENIHSPIFIHKADEYRLLEPNKYTVWKLPIMLEAFKASQYLEDGENLDFGTLHCEIIHTPGHTEGGICIYFPSENIVFTGDTLFNMSVGRVDLPGGNWDLLNHSIRNKLLVLPAQTDVYCGHGEPTTIGFERNNNPFLNKNTIY